MIIAKLGRLSTVQALTAGSTDSSNVIEIAAIDFSSFSDLWWVVDTNVVAGGAGTLLFDLVVAQEDTLDNVVSVYRAYMAAVTDVRVATAGRHIAAMNIGKTLTNILDTDGSDYEFIGMISTLGGSATISIDASLSPTPPHTEHHKQVVTSPVTVPGAASAGS